ncbi:hypothetical protein BLOT_015345 [Blomia tropicalis]|nr:hypothetical protein BLOT_015345 [Blomia tropicalis]
MDQFELIIPLEWHHLSGSINGLIFGILISKVMMANCSISNHLTNSNTLLNVHLRPNRSNSLRAKNAKSQS